MLPIASGRYLPHANVEDEFTEYEGYDQPDWDGYGAEPISRETVRAARSFSRLLPPSVLKPDVAPGADGTIGFEWRFGFGSTREFVLVDVGPGGRVVARRVAADGIIKNFPHTTLTTGAKALINELFAP
ncbi:hypothetical protein [Bradyrhizobium sp. UFLA05-112]